MLCSSLFALSLLPTLLPALAASPALDEAALLYRRSRYAETLARLDKGPLPALQAGQADLLRGLALRRLGREAEAAVPLSRAALALPGELDAHVNLGLALRATGQWAESKGAFEAAAKAKPLRAEPWLGLGMLAAGQGDWEGARASYQKAVELRPRDAKAWLALADALIQLGQGRAAAEAREKALGLGAEGGELRFRQAALWYGLGELDKAAQSLAKAEIGDKPEGYLLAGSLDYRRGDLAGAERNFKAALELKPDYAEAHLNLGIAHYSQGRFAEAAAQLGLVKPRQAGHELAQEYRREALQAGVDSELSQGASAALAGDPSGALAHWDKAEALAEDKAAVRAMIKALRQQSRPRAEELALQGEQALARDEVAGAALAFHEALSVDPDNGRARDGLKRAAKDLARLTAAYRSSALQLAADGDAAGARGLVERLGALDPKAGAALAKELEAAALSQTRELDAKAAQALKEGKPEEAGALLEQAQALAPQDPRLAQKRRGAEAALRRKVGALLAASTEAESAGKLQAAYEKAAQAQQASPQDLEARRAAESLASRLNLKRLDAKAVDALYYKGVYAYGAGDTRKALAIWEQALEAAPNHGPLRTAVRSARTKLKMLAALGGK